MPSRSSERTVFSLNSDWKACVPRLIRDSRHYSRDRKSTRLNSSHSQISYAVFCLKKKNEALHDRVDALRADHHVFRGRTPVGEAERGGGLILTEPRAPLSHLHRRRLPLARQQAPA